jgi:hypothetical protein
MIERTKKIIDELNNLGFSDFLKSKNFNEDKIENLIKNKSRKKSNAIFDCIVG